MIKRTPRYRARPKSLGEQSGRLYRGLPTKLFGSATLMALSGGMWFIEGSRIGAIREANLPADQKMIERVKTAAVNEKIERRSRPQKGVFEPERIPEIAAHAPAF